MSSTSDTATLNKHAWHNTMDLSILIADWLAITFASDGTVTETHKVLAGFGRNVLEQLKDHNS